MSRTKKTELEYYERGLSLLRRAYLEAEEEGHDFSDKSIRVKVKSSPLIVMEVFYAAIWAVKKWSFKYRPNTWSKYRCSIRFVAKLFFEKNKIDQETFEKICYVLDNSSGGDRNDLEPKTSSNKKKSFSIKEYNALEELVNSGNYRWGKPSLHWIKASILIGLRPIEWKDTEYEEYENVLIVKNAKNTNGRANGSHRKLSLNHLSEEELEVVLKHADFARRMEENDNWDIYYQGCSNFIKYAVRKMWPKKERLPSLYSGRHQFSANMKASGCKRKEVAALMGHNTDETASQHYGKKIFGTRVKKPEVNNLDLSKVKSVKLYKFSFKNKKENK